MSVNFVEKENKEKDLSTGQILLFKKMFSNGDIPELEIVAHEKEDVEKILHFMMNN